MDISGPVSDLTRDDFVVCEDGQEQTIVMFRQKDWPNIGEAPGQYELAYYPPSKDGEFKKIRVRFRDAKNAKDKGLGLVCFPKGYFAVFDD